MAVTEQTTAAIEEIAAQLGETEVEARRQIGRAVPLLGEERVRACVVRALEIEAAGGCWRPTAAGGGRWEACSSLVVRDDVGRKDFYRIFKGGQHSPGTGGASAGTGARAAATVTPPFDGAPFGAAATEAMSGAGDATTVKLPRSGKPGNVVERGDGALVVMRSEKAPSLSKGVPAPESPQTDDTALVGMKQWTTVAEALAANPDDKVIIEGYPTVRPDVAGITVHATSATTGIQAGKRTATPAAL